MSVRVLLVDPDKSIALAFAKSLPSFGFEVFSASNESDALLHLCESAPDVIVLEPVTPDGWGFRFLSNQDLNARPTIVLSCWNEDDVSASFDIQCDEWLTKPKSTRDLAASIDRAIQVLQ